MSLVISVGDGCTQRAALAKSPSIRKSDSPPLFYLPSSPKSVQKKRRKREREREREKEREELVSRKKKKECEAAPLEGVREEGTES